MIDKTLPKELCCGCFACEAACPFDAIDMSKKGFYNPVVNEKCTQCELCVKTCPVLKSTSDNFSKPRAYAILASDEIRASGSSSGGVFPVLAKHFLSRKGYVCGAAFTRQNPSDKLPQLKHIIINNEKDLPLLQGSKYLQSDLSGVYEKIKELLVSGKEVLFSALPCEVAGLRKYLKKPFANLFCLDIICHGTPSYDIWAKYMKEEHKGEYLNSIDFRDKIHGWRGELTITTTTTRKSASEDIYMRAFLNNLSINSACLSCKFSTFARSGDITMGDFWGVASWDKSLDDTKCTSLIFLNSPKGEELFDELKTSFKVVKEAPFEIARRSNLNLNRPSIAHQNYRLFWQLINSGASLKKAVEVCLDDVCDFGIYNFWFSNNYGASLTAFALQQLIKERGYTSKILNFGFDEAWHKSFGAKFAKKYLDLSKPYDLKSLELGQYNFKALAFGSDQVIRPDFGGELRGRILLSFLGLNQQKLMLSASWGQNFNEFSKNPAGKKLRKLFSVALNSFDYLSFREASGVDIAKGFFDLASDFMIDPVFMLEKAKFEDIANDDKTKLPPKYILAYLLDDYSDKNELFESLKARYNMPVVLLTLSGSCPVELFLKAIINSHLVVTDSFHGFCFALIFNKNFFAIKEKHWRGDERFDNIKAIIKQESNFFSSVQEIINSKALPEADFEAINSSLAPVIANSKKLLDFALGGEHELAS